MSGGIGDHHPSRDHIQPTILRRIAEIKAATTIPEHSFGYYVFYGVRLFRTAEEWQEYKQRTGWPRGGHGHGRG